jgi:hypothetical protein
LPASLPAPLFSGTRTTAHCARRVGAGNPKRGARGSFGARLVRFGRASQGNARMRAALSAGTHGPAT